MIGFETIGNATATFFDDKPILSTDPWILGNPYFGSWGHKYKIPKLQLENIMNSKYIWLSHGHPDHIDPDSLDMIKNKKIILAKHYGSRIYKDLSKRGFDCFELKNNHWFELTKNIRIKNFADWNQDSSLLVEIKKKDIVLNLNDGQALGWSKEIKKIIKNYSKKFLLRLISWGDADMINFYGDNNHFILPLAASKKPCGESYSFHLKKWNCNMILPFSSMHKYVRKDSIKMNEYVTPLELHYEKFNSKDGEMLPAFIQWNTEKQQYIKINPDENKHEIKNPEQFGDNWSDILNREDEKTISDYFLKFDHLKSKFGFLSFSVGNKEFNLKLSNRKEGIKFTAPRNSLVSSIRNKIFDDILIGNFMKVQLINVNSLYPDFTPYVAKYGDNGGVNNKVDIKNYFNYYRLNSANYWTDLLNIKTEGFIRAKLIKNKNIYFFARKINRYIS
jgi:hypothetical protein